MTKDDWSILLAWEDGKLDGYLGHPSVANPSAIYMAGYIYGRKHSVDDQIEQSHFSNETRERSDLQ